MSNKLFTFVSGAAGSGKTTLIKERIKKNNKYALLTSSTGIAAINLDESAITLASALHYFDTASMLNSYKQGYLINWLRKAIKDYNNLVIEEVSMLPAKQLDIVYSCINELNSEGYKKRGLILVGDMCQLAVVNGEMAFEANCWPEFESNTIRLDKIWRQSNTKFIEALSLLRAGKAREAVKSLVELNTEFRNDLDNDFDGTTIVPTNEEVKHYNAKRLIKLNKKIVKCDIRRDGKQLNEWTKFIPIRLSMAIGAYVMILTNAKDFSYGNGDCGFIRDYKDDKFYIELIRNKKIVVVGRITRNNLSDKRPDKNNGFLSHTDFMTGKWVIGKINYHPIRLAYATSSHKSQGLTLDRVQIDISHKFFGSPSMAYVAISRVRSIEGLKIVGTPKLLENRITIDERIKRWV